MEVDVSWNQARCQVRVRGPFSLETPSRWLAVTGVGVGLHLPNQSCSVCNDASGACLCKSHCEGKCKCKCIAQLHLQAVTKKSTALASRSCQSFDPCSHGRRKKIINLDDATKFTKSDCWLIQYPRPSLRPRTIGSILYTAPVPPLLPTQMLRNRHQSEVDTRSPLVMSDGRPRYLTPNIRALTALQDSVAYLMAIVLEDFETFVPFQPF